jgi:hypothetical protein
MRPMLFNRSAGVREFNLDGELLVPDGTAVFRERSIYAAIYAARPAVDVGSRALHPYSDIRPDEGLSVYMTRPEQPLFGSYATGARYSWINAWQLESL